MGKTSGDKPERDIDPKRGPTGGSPRVQELWVKDQTDRGVDPAQTRDRPADVGFHARKGGAGQECLGGGVGRGDGYKQSFPCVSRHSQTRTQRPQSYREQVQDCRRPHSILHNPEIEKSLKHNTNTHEQENTHIKSTHMERHGEQNENSRIGRWKSCNVSYRTGVNAEHTAHSSGHPPLQGFLQVQVC